MGFDPLTIGIITLGVTSASLSIAGGVKANKRAKKQAEAVALEGQIKSNERARKVKQVAGQQRAAFLSSGISLTGEGTTESVLGETFKFGEEDIDLITKNTQTQVDNILAAGRSEMLSGFAEGAFSLVSSFALPAFGVGSGVGTGADAAFSAGQAGKFSNVAGLGAESSAFFGF